MILVERIFLIERNSILSYEKDLILAASDHYDYNQLKYWVNSIKQSGFSGDICVMIFNATFDTVEKLVENGVMVVTCDKDEENKKYFRNGTMMVHVERFFHFYNILRDNAWKYRFVITTDIRDIVFQKNPSEFLEQTLIGSDRKVVVSSESLLYKDEPWGNKNLEQTFGPFFHDYYKNNPIYNVGLLAGNSLYIRDLCLHIFLMSTNRPIPICDQSTFNVLMYNAFYQDLVHYSDVEIDGWAAHLGTMMDPTKIEKFGPLLLEKPPVFSNGALRNSNGEIITVVHQYDRVPELKQFYEEKFR